MRAKTVATAVFLVASCGIIGITIAQRARWASGNAVVSETGEVTGLRHSNETMQPPHIPDPKKGNGQDRLDGTFKESRSTHIPGAEQAAYQTRLKDAPLRPLRAVHPLQGTYKDKNSSVQQLRP